MNERFLLDTNAAIAYMAQETSLLVLIENADAVFVPSIVLGELFYGAEKSGRIEANRVEVETFAMSGAVLNCDAGSARQYGRIRQMLRSKGKPIPQNDTWIAVLALQHNLILLTKDHHFNEVDGLLVQGW
jgi:tRNA(fMet)-specific endonuclease VapC